MVKLYDLCIWLAEHTFFTESLHIATNYLSREEYKPFGSKYRDSISLNMLFNPSVSYTQREYYGELRRLVDISAAPGINHLVNKISERYIIDHEFSYITNILFEPVQEAIFIKYKIKTMLTNLGNTVSACNIKFDTHVGTPEYTYTLANYDINIDGLQQKLYKISNSAFFSR